MSSLTPSMGHSLQSSGPTNHHQSYANAPYGYPNIAKVEPVDQKGRRIEWVTETEKILKEKSLSKIFTEGEPVTFLGKAVFGTMDWLNKCGQATLKATYSCAWLREKKDLKPDEQKIKITKDGCDESKQCHIEESSLDYMEALAQDACLENGEIKSAHLQVNFKNEGSQRSSHGKWYLVSQNNLLKSESQKEAYSINLIDSARSINRARNEECSEDAESLNSVQLDFLVEKIETELFGVQGEKVSRLEGYLVKQYLIMKKADKIYEIVFQVHRFYCIFDLFFSDDEARQFKLTEEWKKLSSLSFEEAMKGREAAKELEKAEIELEELNEWDESTMRSYLKDQHSIDFDLVDHYNHPSPQNDSMREIERERYKYRRKVAKQERERKMFNDEVYDDVFRHENPLDASSYPIVDSKNIDNSPDWDFLRNNTDLDLLGKEINQDIKNHLEDISLKFGKATASGVEKLINDENIQKKDVEKIFKVKPVKKEDIERITEILQVKRTKKAKTPVSNSPQKATQTEETEILIPFEKGPTVSELVDSSVSNLPNKPKHAATPQKEEFYPTASSHPHLSEEEREMFKTIDPLEVDSFHERRKACEKKLSVDPMFQNLDPENRGKQVRVACRTNSYMTEMNEKLKKYKDEL